MIPNYDNETGIHYGCISQHSIDPDAMSEIWDQARDLSYESAKDELLSNLINDLKREDAESVRHALSTDLSDIFGMSRREERADVVNEIVGEWEAMDMENGEPSEADKETIWALISDRFNDLYECDDRSWLWEKDGYELSNCLITDIFVGKSPYFTYAPECSPCVPNAGNLDSAEWFDGAEPSLKAAHIVAERTALRKGWLKTYCLGHDMFEGGNAPYPVWSVDSGEFISPKGEA
jgi:hypothetical protein